MSEIILDEEEETETHTWNQANEIDPNWDYDGETHRGGTGYPSGAIVAYLAAGIVLVIAAIILIAAWILLNNIAL